MSGLFVVLDGVEGCGKSTQSRLLAEALRVAGREVLLTHEPGGTPVGEAIRRLLLDPAYPEMTPLTEVLLFCASRAQHCEQVIAPALQAGRTVICDRFASATLAYQGFAGQVGAETVRAINGLATAGLTPALTLILDADPLLGLRRKFGDAAASGDRIEEKSLAFHQAVRDGFLQVAALDPGRCLVIEADAPPEAVHQQVLSAVLSCV
jgi:dTMP kinase